MLSEYNGLADSLGLPGCLTSSATGSNVDHVFDLATHAAIDRTKVPTTVLRRIRRPTSLKLEDRPDTVLRAISPKQKHLRSEIEKKY